MLCLSEGEAVGPHAAGSLPTPTIDISTSPLDVDAADSKMSDRLATKDTRGSCAFVNIGVKGFNNFSVGE